MKNNVFKGMHFKGKLVTIILLVIALSVLLTSCTPVMSKQEKAVCEEADEILMDVVEIFNGEFSRDVKKIDGKLVYIAYLKDVNPSESDAEAIADYIFDPVEKILKEEGILLAVYYGNPTTDEVYRMFDARKIDGDKLDRKAKFK